MTNNFGSLKAVIVMSSYKIAVVVDRLFGNKLIEIAKHNHVWVCDTPINLAAVQAAIAQLEPDGVWNENGVTTFRVNTDETSEEMIISNLSMIDLHHYEYSHDPAWSQIKFYGTSLTPLLSKELQEYGVTEFHEMPEGFVCRRAELKPA